MRCNRPADLAGYVAAEVNMVFHVIKHKTVIDYRHFSISREEAISKFLGTKDIEAKWSKYESAGYAVVRVSLRELTT